MATPALFFPRGGGTLTDPRPKPVSLLFRYANVNALLLQAANAPCTTYLYESCVVDHGQLNRQSNKQKKMAMFTVTFLFQFFLFGSFSIFLGRQVLRYDQPAFRSDSDIPICKSVDQRLRLILRFVC